jgi:hypothetical protein
LGGRQSISVIDRNYLLSGGDEVLVETALSRDIEIATDPLGLSDVE